MDTNAHSALVSLFQMRDDPAILVIGFIFVIVFVVAAVLFVKRVVMPEIEKDKANREEIKRRFGNITRMYSEMDDDERKDVRGQLEGFLAPFVNPQHLDKWSTNLDKLHEIQEKRGKKKQLSPMSEKAEALQLLEAEYEDAVRNNPGQRLALRMMYEEEKRKILES